MACAVHRAPAYHCHEVGEFDLIARLAAVLGPLGAGVTTGIGDEAAVLAPDLVVSTDLTVEDVTRHAGGVSVGGRHRACPPGCVLRRAACFGELGRVRQEYQRLEYVVGVLVVGNILGSNAGLSGTG